MTVVSNICRSQISVCSSTVTPSSHLDTLAQSGEILASVLNPVDMLIRFLLIRCCHRADCSRTIFSLDFSVSIQAKQRSLASLDDETPSAPWAAASRTTVKSRGRSSGSCPSRYSRIHLNVAPSRSCRASTRQKKSAVLFASLAMAPISARVASSSLSLIHAASATCTGDSQ
jgi:hypothetical protein